MGGDKDGEDPRRPCLDRVPNLLFLALAALTLIWPFICLTGAIPRAAALVVQVALLLVYTVFTIRAQKGLGWSHPGVCAGLATCALLLLEVYNPTRCC